MSINYAILGILSSKSLTGYDIKKIIQDSPFMYWSGNNNQIYKALLELHEEDFVTSEVQHQDSSPSKKVYTITEDGLAALKAWVLSAPEAPEIKKTFLIQLAWAGQLNSEELNTLLTGYENEIKTQILLQQEKKRRETFSPARSPKEEYLWDMIHDNIVSSYKNELIWVQKLRNDLLSNDDKEANKMPYTVLEKDNKTYIEYASPDVTISKEQDILDILSACYEFNTALLLIHEEILPDEFFKLRTGLAGQVLQKFANYRVKAAVVLKSDQRINGKFKDLMSELNKGNDFRMFYSAAEAEKWLLT